MDKLKIFFDIDGVLCSTNEGKYEESFPNQEMIDLLNSLYDEGHEISIYTSRFMGRLNENTYDVNEYGFEQISLQLKKWGINYSRLILGKPRYDIFIDDKSYRYKVSDSLLNLKKIISDLKNSKGV